MSESTSISFAELALSAPILKALSDVGYEAPSPIQAEVIPHMIEGLDVLGQAQTGTGKTAAFALPLLTQIDIKQKAPQVLVLTPTRELAIQVAEAFQSYARHLKGFRVAPIYGGQSYSTQLKQLQRGLHVVVGTPGRVMDHMRRGKLDLGELKCLVLDEADEMLRMGFVEDVEWVLANSPTERQIALFSATMPKEIRRIANTYQKKPIEISIKQRVSTAETIEQTYWMVRGTHKLDALTRILEVESFDAMLCFVRTKTATVELADKLNARGLAATALNGDIAQNQREQTIERLKNGKLDIVVATDVAARGLDVDRISHVINYDIPYDTEAYVHRIGRTGRAGRSGKAILFVSPREQRMLRAIERATGQRITEINLPSNEVIAKKRIAEFKEKALEALSAKDLTFYRDLVVEILSETEIEIENLAAALAMLAQGDHSLVPKKEKPQKEYSRNDEGSSRRNTRHERSSRGARAEQRGGRTERGRRPSSNSGSNSGADRYRIAVGKVHGISAGNILGAIANEGNLDSQDIGAIRLFDEYSTVELPKNLPDGACKAIGRARVAGQQLRIRPDFAEQERSGDSGRPSRRRGKDESGFKGRRRSGSSPRSGGQERDSDSKERKTRSYKSEDGTDSTRKPRKAKAGQGRGRSKKAGARKGRARSGTGSASDRPSRRKSGAPNKRRGNE